MPPMSQKRRRLEDGMRGKIERPKKRVRHQTQYHSSSDDDDDGSDGGFAPINLADSDDEVADVRQEKKSKQSKQTPQEKKNAKLVAESSEVEDEDEEDEDEDDDHDDANDANDNDDDETGTESDSADDASHVDSEEEGEDDDAAAAATSTSKRPKTKRNDPEAFSVSMQKILGTKLSQSARADPVLSRSKDAVDASASLANERLEARVRAKVRRDRKDGMERGRVKDVLGLNSGKAGEVAAEEKRLRKVAQRGVVKLFNAVRAAQVSAEKAAREERKKGTIGMGSREERVNEMSKQGFLDFIGGDKKQQTAVEAGAGA